METAPSLPNPRHNMMPVARSLFPRFPIFLPPGIKLPVSARRIYPPPPPQDLRPNPPSSQSGEEAPIDLSSSKKPIPHKQSSVPVATTSQGSSEEILSEKA